MALLTPVWESTLSPQASLCLIENNDIFVNSLSVICSSIQIGEPRPKWPQSAKRLKGNGVITHTVGLYQTWDIGPQFRLARLIPWQC